MPTVQHSPEPLPGYDKNLQLVTDEGNAAGAASELDLIAPTSHRTRSRLGAVGTFSRSLSRRTPVSTRSRPLCFQGAAGCVSQTPPPRPITRSSGLPLDSSTAFSPASPTSDGLGEWNNSGNTTSSTHFGISIINTSDEQSDSSRTLIPGSVDNSEEEEEILLSPTAREIIAEINAMPVGFTTEMDRAAMIHEHRKILIKACEYENISPANAPIDEIRSAISIAKEWTDKI